ncbi:hypothetical protein CNYM01_11350 [Colletotrichum nymphaeae SA-01]|uniref:Uncharacterized protein n=1 Tax=Colletotrichum nymphaeae SA-01 TaxID=1460502 RepID=A0A135SSP3_9PEZI|nr:hypothetical protein CNYM01_11350 [Colletotrichum nymphaeae SA-01]
MTTLTEELAINARILAAYMKENALEKSESRVRQRKLTVRHDPRSVATRPQSIANMSHAKKTIISTNETDRAVSVGGGRENQLVRVQDHRLRQHWKSIRRLSRVLRHIHRHLRDGNTPGAHARAWVAHLQTLPDTGD